MFSNVKKVDTKIVHKNSEDDVLIYNVRPVLPSWLDDSTIKEAENKFSNEIFQKFKNFYRYENGKYILNSIPNKLSKNTIDEINKSFPQIENVIKEFYEMCDDHFLLSSRWVPEYLEYELSKTFQPNNNFLEIEERCELYKLLKQLESSNLLEMEYSTLFNDTQNYFFYRKHHEHVPGLMIIEAARQAVYSQFYCFSGYSPNEVSLSLSDTSCRFLQYIESCYPVDILVSDSDMNPIFHPKFSDKKAQFFQNCLLVAEISFKFHVIKMPIFKRIRDINISCDRWFMPIKNIKKEMMLICDDGESISAGIQFLSMSEMQLTFDVLDRKLSDLKLVQCIFYVDTIGFIRIPIDTSRSDDNVIVISFPNLDAKIKMMMKKILKEFCYFVKDKSNIKQTH